MATLRLLVVGVLLASAVARAARVDVTIDSDDKLPTGALLVAVVKNPDVQGASPQSMRAITDASGRFSVDLPDPGTYVICAGSLEGELLDSCQWPNESAVVSVPANGAQRAIKATVTLQKGTRVRLRVLDPQGLVPTPTNPNRSGFLRAGVWSGGRFYFAQLVGFDNGRLDYEVIVPKGTDVHISFQSAGISVDDDQGEAVTPGRDTVSFRTQDNESNRVRTFRARTEN